MMFKKLLIILLLVEIGFADIIDDGNSAYEKKDYQTALSLYKKACGAGYAVGCNNIGTIYANGNGVRQNDELGLKYFGKACDMKLEPGCENYARLKKSR